jgi:hypothetical protein
MLIFPLPNASTVSTQAAAAPAFGIKEAHTAICWIRRTGHCYGVEIRRRNTLRNTSRAQIFDAQLLRRAARAVQRFDCSCLGIVEETEGITIRIAPSKFITQCIVLPMTDEPTNPAPRRFSYVQRRGSSDGCVGCKVHGCYLVRRSRRRRQLMDHDQGFSVPAFPPCLSISNPASVANGLDEETTPFVPYTTDRRLGKRWKTGSALSTLDQSIIVRLSRWG